MKKKHLSPLSFLWDIIKRYKYYYLLMMLAPIGSGIYPVIYNFAVKQLIDLFINNTHITLVQSMSPILWFISGQIILDGGWRIHNYSQLKAMPYVLEEILLKTCEHCFYLPYTYYQNNLSGSIVAKIKGIGDKYFKIHQAFEYTLSRPLMITLFSGYVLAYTNIKIFFFIISFIAIYSPFSFFFFLKLAKIEKQKQDSWYHLFGTVSDRISNIFTIFSFAARKNEIQKTKDYYKNTHNPLTVKYYKYDLIISFILSTIYWIFLTSLFIFVIQLKNEGEISIGDIAFIMALTLAFVENTWATTMALKDFLEDIAAFKSAFSIMQEQKCSIDPLDAKQLNVIKGEIIFKNILFHYSNGHNIFDGLNLHIKAGEKIGIVGHSGAGKSTLIALLLKNFKQNSGDIMIDDQNIRDTSSDSVRANIAIIPQDIMLFHRSIAENIAYAKKDATMEEIKNAAKMANIHNFIMNLSEQYNTRVGERGIKLSGGQRQRIAIARAILKNAPILILDEATSSLDSKTESDIQNSIRQILDHNKTTVIAIAHRLSTIKHMDRIIVMDGGKIIEDGAFQELLMIPNGKFKALWDHQVNGMIV